jgi:ABC-type transport system involved in Fe-S cluster assembly fused permease/ATPase subunit
MIQPPSHSSKQNSSLATLRTFLPYLWPKEKASLRLRVVVAIILLVISKLANISVPIIYKLSVESLTKNLSVSSQLLSLPIFLIIVYGLTRITSQVFSELKDALFARVSQYAVRTFALQVFRQLHNLSLRFHLDRQTGGLSNSIEKGVKAIETLLRFLIFNIVPTFFEIILVASVLWIAYDVRFAIVTSLTLVIYIGFTLRFTEWRTNFVRTLNKVDAEANTKALDSLLNYETVKYFGNEEHEAQRYDQSLISYQETAIKSTHTLSYLNIGQGIIISIGLMIVMAMAANGVQQGTMTVGDFVLVNTYLIQLYMPLNILGFAYREIKLALVNMENMFQLLREPQEIKDAVTAPPLHVQEGEIEFKDVFFAYNPDRPILKGVSFKIPKGRTLAIVGASGAGKSTIARLLFRFYDVTGGAILIDGQDIRSVTQQSLRAAIGVVPQDTVLFNDTIYYNIAYGRPTASRQEVEQAARLAKIHDFILSLPQGYETIVGERGLKLSGGEKQRVAIARTILKQPSIFLFDEATSALDSQTEKSIQQSMQEVSVQHTTIIIAHRLSTIVHANEILVLDQGHIVERGTHQYLMQRKGVYAAMWQKQQETHKANDI